MKRIEVVREKDKLNKETWEFIYIESRHALVLIQYLNQTRSTTRHKFKTIEAWDAHKDRRRYYDPGVVMTEAPLPDDVQDEAVQKFTDSLKIQIGFLR